VGLWKTFAASAALMVIGLAVLLRATAQGNAFTTETLRRTAIAEEAQPVPEFELTDDTGRATTLRQVLGADGRVWIIEFVYTRCQTICTSLGVTFQRLQQLIAARGLQDRVGLLSISFDPQHDTPQALRSYARRMKIDPEAWRIVTLALPQDRRRLLDAFGIMVIPAPLGEFEHNASLHVVDARGMLVRIVDFDDIDQALAVALSAAR
jgi:protein SCO1/2